MTALAETDTPQGWRPVKATGGCLIDVPSGETWPAGFAMPHSPRVHGGRVWVLNSGTGRLVVVDPAAGGGEDVTEVPGLHPRAGDGRPLRVHRAVEDPRDVDLRGRADRRARATS